MATTTWSRWEDNLSELIRRTSSSLPKDVEKALMDARDREASDSSARWALDIIIKNIHLARERSAPLCQDTGALLFFVRAPKGFDVESLSGAIRSAVVRATAAGHLRQNTIDTLTGVSRAENVGAGAPSIYAQCDNVGAVEITLIMKGGGSENVGAQYSLPDARLKAARDWNGVQRCALDVVHRAQGMGCAPGVLGICVGGDRASGFDFAERQFLRRLDDRSRVPVLARLEAIILKKANAAGIGPMGFGGATSLLDVKIGALSRLPASYFVSVAYMCWAFRRRGVVMRVSDGSIQKWLY